MVFPVSYSPVSKSTKSQIQMMLPTQVCLSPGRLKLQRYQQLIFINQRPLNKPLSLMGKEKWFLLGGSFLLGYLT